MKINAAVISENPEVRDPLVEALESVPRLNGIWILNEYPGNQKLAELVEANNCILFLDCSNSGAAMNVAKEVDDQLKLVTTVAVLRADGDSGLLLGLIRAGVREVLSSDWSYAELRTLVDQVERRWKKEPEPTEEWKGEIRSFLPARPGSGTTTVATNTAMALSRRIQGSTLLMDFDLRLGMTSFLLKLQSTHSVREALECAPKLDDDFWTMLVTQMETLDVLGSAPSEAFEDPPLQNFAALLNHSRRRYDHVLIDLAGTMRPEEMATLERSTQIYLVSTPDLGCLHMARRKAELLKSFSLSSRTVVVMNKVDHRALSHREMENIIGLPVQYLLPADEKSVAAAVSNGSTVNGSTSLGRLIASLAESMARETVATSKGSKRKTRRFVDYFSVSKAKLPELW